MTDLLPLTANQEVIWFEQKLYPGVPLYNIGGYLVLHGAIRPELLNQAVQGVIVQNDALRIKIHEVDHRPYQEFLSPFTYPLEFIDFSGQNNPGQTARQWMQRQFKKNIDTHTSPLFQLALLKLHQHQYYFFFKMHHLIIDGWGISLFCNYLAQAYNRLLPGITENSRDNRRCQYKDYVLKQQNAIDPDRFERDKTFWRHTLTPIPEPLLMPKSKPGTDEADVLPANQRETIILKRLFYNRLMDTAAYHQVSLFHVFTGLFYTYFSRIYSKQDLAVGIPLLSRGDKKQKQTIGLYTGVLPLRLCLDHDISLTELFGLIAKELRQCYRHQRLPIDEIYKSIGFNFSLRHLYDLSIVYLKQDYNFQLGGHAADPPVSLSGGYKQTPFAVEVCDFSPNQDIQLHLDYRLDYFTQQEIMQICRHFNFLLENLFHHLDANTPLKEIEILTPREKYQLLTEFNDTTADYPGETTIHQLFAGQVEQTPDRIALIGMINSKFEIRNSQQIQMTEIQNSKQEGTRGLAPLSDLVSITYSELNEKSRQLAYLLVKKGVRPDAIVGIMMDRCVEMIVGILGILKAGGAYMPIDPGYPADRIEYMLKDSNVGVLATTPKLQVKVKAEVKESAGQPRPPLQFIHIHTDPAFAVEPSTSTLTLASTCQVSPTNLAYIIYTSGSTGQPKGIMIEHKSLVNYINWANAFYLKDKELGNFGLYSPITFDLTITSIFCPLTVGKSLYIFHPSEEIHSILEHSFNIPGFIDCMKITPSHINLLESLNISSANVKFVIVGGEELTKKHVDILKNIGRSTEIVNEYGPTEATVGCIIKRVEKGEMPILIGKPITGVKVFILCREGKLLPPGIPGEICISGVALARGYLNNPGLTAEKFDHDLWDLWDYQDGYHRSYRSYKSYISKKLYHTGDLGRWLPDGNIEFLGRKDLQVKIRGVRIELGEIEHRLLNHADIREAVVTAEKDAAGNKFLCAYVVPGSPTHPLAQLHSPGLREYLSKFLPAYMIPTHFVQLEELPLTPNGKIDRKALEQVTVGADKLPVSNNYVPPGNETEENLAKIWQEILGIEKIGIYDNFFDCGGHSLKAAQVVSRVYKEMSVEIGLSAIFEKPNIAGLAGIVKQKRHSAFFNIQPVEEREYYDLTNAQRRLWVLCQFEEESISYNMPGAFLLEGELNANALNEAYRALIQRHDSLRTGFKSIKGEPGQIVHKKVDFKIECSDAESEESARATARQHAAVVFDLSAAPLFKIKLLKLAGRKNVNFMLINMHHIISDGWSIDIFINELGTLYNKLAAPDRDIQGPAGHETILALAPLRIQYKDYTRWQNQLLQEEKIGAIREYWHQTLGGGEQIPVLELPTDYLRPAVRTHYGGSIDYLLGKELTSGLDILCQKQGVTLFMVLLAAVNLLLWRYTGQDDIIIGSPAAGRGHLHLENQVGLYVNTLALRHNIKESDSFEDLLQQVKQTTTRAYDNQIYPFDRLVDELNLTRNIGRHPLFDVMVVMQNNRQNEFKFANIEISPFEMGFNASKFDLTFYFTGTTPNNNIYVSVAYNTDIFKKERMELLVKHFETLLKAVLKNPGLPVEGLSILSAKEKQWAQDFNKEIPGIEPSTVIESFLGQVKQRPGKTAVIYDNGALTYSELNRLTHDIAVLLKELGINNEIAASAMFGTDIRQIISIISIFKAGGIYAAVDADTPVNRFRQMLCKAAPAVVLAPGETLAKMREYLVSGECEYKPKYFIEIAQSLDLRIYRCTGDTFIPVDRSLAFTTSEGFENRAHAQSGSYIFFTSGSTGEPKAILGTHESLHHFIRWELEEFKIDENCRCGFLSSPTFDASLRDIFVPLCSGGTLYIPGKPGPGNFHKLLAWTASRRLTLLHTIPSLLRSLVNTAEDSPDAGMQLGTLEHVLSSGEPLYGSDVQKWRKWFGEAAQLVNFYGPTETTMIKTFYRIPRDFKRPPGYIPAGKPLPNTKIAIIHKNRPCAVGETGEIYIKTAYPTKGYYKNKELTRSVFVPNPLTGDMEDIVYRTGDLGRYLPDMTFEVLGRIDNQVKINGIRVEPEEIEHQLLKHPHIKKVAVLASETMEQIKLIAFVVSSPGWHPGLHREELRAHLAQYLPGFMIPSLFIRLEKLPLTHGGKVDRKSLSRLAADTHLLQVSDNYVPPGTGTEEKLIKIWQEVLGIEKIGITDNFFDLGGHSLKAVQIVSRIYKEMSVEIDLSAIFRNPTTAGLAGIIKQKKISGLVTIQPGEEREYYDVSNAQRRLWVLCQFENETAAYNMASAFRLKGELNIHALNKAFLRLIERHESLRTSFRTIEGKPKQIIHKTVDFEIECRDTLEAEMAEKMARQHAALVFDFSLAPLLNVKLLKLKNREHILLFNMHHIIGDVWSSGILVDELGTFYNVFAAPGTQHPPLPPPLLVQYKDYTLWQNKILHEEKINEIKEFWHRTFAGGDIPLLDMPADYPRPTVQTFNGSSMDRVLDKELSAAVNNLCRKQGVTLFMTLLAAVQVLLYRYSGQDDIIIGSPASGRHYPDLDDQVGFYVNTLALRQQVMGNDTFEGFLQQVKQTTMKAYENQIYPFDRLVNELNLTRDTGRHPLFDVMVVVHNNQQRQLKFDDIEIKSLEIQSYISKFDLTFDFTGNNGEILISIEYNTDLFKNDRILRLCNHFCELVKNIAADPGQIVQNINILPVQEKRQLLIEFNDTKFDYPNDKTIVDLFNQQVEKTPDNVSVVSKEKHFSYRELNEKSDGWAGFLSRNNVLSDTIVGIILERSIEMIIGILAILKTGAAYLPIDPEYPGERINYILTDSGARILLKKSEIRNPKYETNPNDSNSNDQNKRAEVKVLDFEHLNFEFVSNFEFRASNLKSSNLAYIIYTSGSTGRPKGVMVEHRSVIDAVCWFIGAYRITSLTRVLQHTNYIFDPFVEQVFGALFQGARLELVPKEIDVDVEMLYEFLETRQINIIDVVPSFLDELLGHKPKINSIRHVISGGEPLSNHLKDRIIGKGYALYNHYGPTETTIEVLTGRCTKASVTLGKPTANTRCYILDSKNQLLPIGAAGEICINSAGLARGYLNNPELTAEKFGHDLWDLQDYHDGYHRSYRSYKSYISKKVYKTGDLGRWLPDGNIEFLGRRDRQVKIRGFRIELGEIQQRLSQHEDIKQAVVIANDVNQQKELIAFAIEKRPGHFSHARMRDYLSRFLPHYMIPSYFVSLERFPRTVDGAIDQKGLIKLASESWLRTASTNYIPPRNQVEKTLAQIWQEVLAKEKIGIRDNFFEIGGDSIKAIQITSRAHKHGIKLEIKHIFNTPTIGELSKYAGKIELKPLDGPVTGIVEFTPIQQWFFQNTINHRHHFNQAMVLYREPGFKEAFIRQVFSELTRHHDALRMVYKTVGNKHRIIQENRGLAGKLFDFEVFHFEHKNKDMIQKETREQANRLQAGIDLETGPLVKLGLFKTGSGDHLLIVVHHLVIDGVSWRILLEDFQIAYTQQEKGEPIRFQEKTTSFQHWAKKQKQYARSHILGRELNYWKNILQSSAHPLPKMKDLPPNERTYRDSETVTLDFTLRQTRELLEQSSRAFNTKVNDLLLTALARSLKEWAGMEKILINLEGHGREQIIEGVDINRTIGWFTTQFPVLLDISQSGDLSYQLQTIKETLRRIPGKGIGFGILRYLSPRGRELADLQEPGINFNYLGVFDQERKQGVLEFSALSTGNRVSPELKQAYPLEINGMVISRKLTIYFTYNKHENTRAAITKLAAGYKAALLEIITLCINKKHRQLTPADYGDSRLGLEDLEKILREVERAGHGTIRRIYPLSPMQEGILYHWLLDKNSDAYFTQNTCQLEGEIDSHKLEESINRLIRKHEILRTLFIYKGIETPKQVVLEDRPIKVDYLDLSTLSPRQQEKQIRHYKQADRSRGFDLCSDPLQRFALYRLNPSTCIFIWSTHHILLDGWSMGILIKELVSYFTLNDESYHGASDLPYRDYIRWLAKQDKEESINYWKGYLEGYERQVYLPGRQQSPGNSEHETFVFIIDEPFATLLKRTASTHRVTLNTALQSAWGILLQQYNSTDDAVFGTVVSGRPPGIDGIERAIGLFINTVPVRIRTRPNQTFSQLAKEVQAAAIRAKNREYLPLVEIQTLSTLKSELINHIIVFENYPLDRQVEKIFAVKTNEFPFIIKRVENFEPTNYDLDVIVKPAKELTLCCNYNARVYQTGIIKKTARHFTRIIEQITKNPGTRIKDIEILTFKEKRQLLVEFNDTAADYPRDKTIHQLFAAQVEQTPDHIALVGPQVKYRIHMTYLSYRELNERIHGLACWLHEKGVKPDTIVAIMMERSVEMIIGILGILKAGGAYLPMDTDYPKERINYMLADSGAKILVTSPVLPGKFEELLIVNCQLLIINERTLDHRRLNNPPKEANSINNYQLTINNLQLKANNLAYIIYTSGSTGGPKGVLMDHGNLVNLVYFQYRFTNIDFSRVLQFTTISFDVSFQEIFSTLCRSGTLYLITEETRSNIGELFAYVERHQVKTLFLATAYLKFIQGDSDYTARIPANVAHIITAGEQLIVNPTLRHHLQNCDICLHNHYGPTETHVVTTLTMPPGEEIAEVPTIGKPVSNTCINILDNYGRLQPAGVIGELIVSGSQVGRGYLNQPELTAEKFDHDLWDYLDYQDFKKGEKQKTNKKFLQGGPGGAVFSKSAPSGRRRQNIYKTGDLARWLTDGNIEFLGRIDQQVKIRGFRIELGEIEYHLSTYPGIKEVAVTAQKINDQDILTAYFVKDSDTPTVSIVDLRDHLDRFLPGYMIPAYFTALENIPLTPNGKIDKKALSRIPLGKEQLAISSRYVPPGDEIEKELVLIWQEVLGREKIGINDSFIDLGGHSLKAVQVISRIYKKMGVDIGVNRFFQNSTIKELALEIKNLQWFNKDEDHNEPGTGKPGEMEIIL